MPSVLLYPCNLMGYLRFLCLIAASLWHFGCTNNNNTNGTLSDNKITLGFPFQVVTVALLGFSLLLDAFDGHVARKYNHTSKFGAFLDLGLDLLAHTLVWNISGIPGSTALLALEWTGGLLIAAFMNQPAASWKHRLESTGNGWLKCYFHNHQQNIYSAYGNISHFVYPIAGYLQAAQKWVYWITFPGLLLYEVITVFLIWVWLCELVYQDEKASQNKQVEKRNRIENAK